MDNQHDSFANCRRDSVRGDAQIRAHVQATRLLDGQRRSIKVVHCAFFMRSTRGQDEQQLARHEFVWSAAVMMSWSNRVSEREWKETDPTGPEEERQR